jgi:hypothetical protein
MHAVDSKAYFEKCKMFMTLITEGQDPVQGNFGEACPGDPEGGELRCSGQDCGRQRRQALLLLLRFWLQMRSILPGMTLNR